MDEIMHTHMCTPQNSSWGLENLLALSAVQNQHKSIHKLWENITYPLMNIIPLFLSI